MITFIDLFAGIGGFRRGMELAGHECIGFCEWDKYAAMSYTSMHLITKEQRSVLKGIDNLKLRQKEIQKEEYKNGEWFSNDIRNVDATSMPRADCWCFGAPCQDFSIAGNRKGLDGDRSSLVREVFRIIAELKEEDRPKYLIYENVKGMLSSNNGWDFACILLEMESLGYDVEYQLFNSKDFGVPQNRERVYTIGHLRGRSGRKIFPITGNSTEIDALQIAQMPSNKKWKNPSAYRVYDENGIAPTLVTSGGGGHEPYIKTAIPVLTPDRIEKKQNGRRFKEDGEPMFTLTAQDRHGVAISTPEIIVHDISQTVRIRKHEVELGKLKVLLKKHKKVTNREISEKIGKPITMVEHWFRSDSSFSIPDENVWYDLKKILGIETDYFDKQITEFEEKDGVFEKSSRVYDENGISPTLTSASANEKIFTNMRIRKLTPKECFRLQGWTDAYFDRAALVNSDSQLYKQAGNGVTVNVVYEIAKRLEVSQ